MPTTKEPLNPTGIDNKLTELYGLSDSNLRAEAVLIRDDFRDWLDDNFTISPAQEDYLDGFSPAFEEFLADMLYITVKNRRPVVYTPLDSTSRASKLLPIINTLEWEHVPGQATSPKGSLQITESA